MLDVGKAEPLHLFIFRLAQLSAEAHARPGGEHGGAYATQKMLEQFLMVKPSTVNGIVDRLEEKGLLRRTTSKTDGRYRILTLTEEGVHFYDDMIRVAHEVENRMERGFTPEELDTLKSYLLRVADNLREEAGE